MANDDAELKTKLARINHLYGLEYEMIRATAAFEHVALRPLFALNGGALVVYMGLVGALRRGEGHHGTMVDLSIGQFAVYMWTAGLALATLAAFFGALSQFAFRKHRGQDVAQAEIELGLRTGSESDTKRDSARYAAEGVGRRKAAVVIGTISLTLFILGFWPAIRSLA